MSRILHAPKALFRAPSIALCTTIAIQVISTVMIGASTQSQTLLHAQKLNFILTQVGNGRQMMVNEFKEMNMTHKRKIFDCVGLSIFMMVMLISTQVVSAQRVVPLTSVSDMRWQPQGERVLVTGRTTTGDYGLWLYNAEMQSIAMLPTDNPVSVDWSPDGTRFAMGRNIVDAKTLETLITIDADSGIGDWSMDGSQVLAWADNSQLGLFDTATGNLVRTIPVGDDFPDTVSWSPNNAYFSSRR